jgi:surface polysaccharide O-acyltransferase-like enzyme
VVWVLNMAVFVASSRAKELLLILAIAIGLMSPLLFGGWFIHGSTGVTNAYFAILALCVPGYWVASGILALGPGLSSQPAFWLILVVTQCAYAVLLRRLWLRLRR